MKFLILSNTNQSKSPLHIWNLLGRKIISSSGEYAGRLVNVYFDSGSIVSILVFYKWKLIYIDATYLQNIQNFHSKAYLILNINPIYLLKGKFVIDSSGKILGKVFKIEQLGSRNDFDCLYIRKKIYKPSQCITKKQIASIQKNILLH